jgi:hypothetical protein
MPPPDRSSLLRLYRDLLAHARRFPSKKRAGIVADVRAEWREKRALADPARVAHAVEVAVRGLATLRKYTALDARAQEWSVQLEQDPLGAGGREQGGEARRRAEAAAQAAADRDRRAATVAAEPLGEIEVLPGGPQVRRLE